MQFSDVFDIGRPPSFPMYLFSSLNDDGRYRDYHPGRILHGHYEIGIGKMNYSLLGNLRSGDVMYVPLFDGEKPTNEVSASWGNEHARLPIYDENISLIKEIGRSVRGIIVGNAGPELSFKDMWVSKKTDDRKVIIDHMCEFVKRMGDTIISTGSTPVFCPVDWDVAIDCYYGDGKYRDTINSMGALQICFCGFQLFGLGTRDGYPIVPHESDTLYWDICPIQEGPPWRQLTDYLRGTDMWSGVEFKEGLQRGNDVVLSEHGFTAGIVGI